MLLLPVALSLSVVISAALLLWALATQRQSLAYLFKPLTTILIIVLAVTAPAPVAEGYRWLVVGGLLFGLAGDIFLMLPRDAFLAGLISFLVGHLLYIAAFVQRGGAQITPWLMGLYLVPPAILLAWLRPHVGKLLAPVVLYALVLTGMGWRASEMWLVTADLPAILATVGSLLFLVSDSVLAVDRFLPGAVGGRRDRLVLSTYFGGQLLIAWSIIGLSPGA